MTQVLARGSQDATSSAGPALRKRGPAYSVLSECLRIQETARAPRLLGRLFGQSPLAPDARSWYRGALGELRVGELLAALGPGFAVIHSVSIGVDWSAIDHVVIGPTGIFSIAAKNHAGQAVSVDGDSLTVNGHRTHHITNARIEASRAGELLTAAVLAASDFSATRTPSTGVDAPIDVTPVIAVVDPGSLTVTSAPSRVVVVRADRLARTITRREHVLSSEAVARIFSTAEFAAIATRAVTAVSDTAASTASIASGAATPIAVHASTFPMDTTAALQARFARLRRRVSAARRRRVFWATSAAAVTFASAMILAAGPAIH